VEFFKPRASDEADEGGEVRPRRRFMRPALTALTGPVGLRLRREVEDVGVARSGTFGPQVRAWLTRCDRDAAALDHRPVRPPRNPRLVPWPRRASCRSFRRAGLDPLEDAAAGSHVRARRPSLAPRGSTRTAQRRWDCVSLKKKKSASGQFSFSPANQRQEKWVGDVRHHVRLVGRGPA